MLERLYCPDFSTVLGREFRNPFEYPKIDTLLWPTLKDIEHDSRGKALLGLTSQDGHPLFYRRGLDISSLVTELKCSDLDGACMQAINLNEKYGISTKTVISYAENYPSLVFPIASPH